MPEGESSESDLKIQLPADYRSSPRITAIYGVNQGRTQEVEDAILKGVDDSIDAFTGVPDVNGLVEVPVISKEQVISLREKIVNIDKDFGTLISGSNLSANELQLAKVMYIYNHILNTVSYADVEFTNDGHVSGLDALNRGYSTASAYSALVKNESVCRGISEAIYLLCKYMEVNAEIWPVERPPHAFNRVNIGGVWYKLDATYEIGITPGAKKDRWSSNYFLRAWGNTSTDYPREQIASMKNFLAGKGLRFEGYPEKPKIQIKPPKIDIRGRSDKRPRIEVRTRSDT
ncbi:TPA: hypothetical protein GX533_00820 [Candidatus Dojkabacteria bacterium]|uniref:Transglutaminase-like domain-containing protein n=1 Tax=Candidatus Dojkabacteria bacterium TaxID=2099670 RepID=A0A832R8R3_9BACT|nr:hypothetical protein [Candidatus Dojkabacteria bacterium]